MRPGSETTIYPGRNPRSFMVFKKFLPFTCRVGPAWSLSLNHYGNLMTSSGFRTSVKCLTKTFCSTRWYMLLCAQQMPHFQIKSLGVTFISTRVQLYPGYTGTKVTQGPRLRSAPGFEGTMKTQVPYCDWSLADGNDVMHPCGGRDVDQ